MTPRACLSLAAASPAVFACAALAVLAAPAAGQERDAPPTVTATGTCTAELVPDRASLAATVARTGPDVARVAAEATAAFNAFRRAVEGLGLPGAVLSSNGLQVSRNMDYSGPRPVSRGYAASASLRIESSDPARLAAVIPLAASARIDDVGEIVLSVSEAARDRAVLDCLPRASADARLKAEAMARGLGATLGPALRVGDYDTTGERPRPVFAPAPAPRAMAVSAPPPDVSVGVQRVGVSTAVTFRLDDATAASPR